MKLAFLFVSLISSVALAEPAWKVRIINPSGVETTYRHKEGALYDFGGIVCSVVNFPGDRIVQKKGLYCNLKDSVVSKVSICDTSSRASLRRTNLSINEVDATSPINIANKNGSFSIYFFCE